MVCRRRIRAARARAAGTLTSAARARDTRVQSLVELLFGTRLGPAQRSAVRATQPWRRIGAHGLAAEQNRGEAGPSAAGSGVDATVHASARAPARCLFVVLQPEPEAVDSCHACVAARTGLARSAGRLGGISARAIRPRLTVGRSNTALGRRPRGSIRSMRGWRVQLGAAGERSGVRSCHWTN